MKKPMVEKSQQTELKILLDFDKREEKEEGEWREKLLEHLQTKHGMSAESCEQLEITFNEGHTQDVMRYVSIYICRCTFRCVCMRHFLEMS